MTSCLQLFKLKLKTKCFTKSPRIRLNLEKRKDSKIVEVFQAKISLKFAAISVLSNDVETLANSLKQVLRSTAEEVAGRQGKQIQLWVTKEVLDLSDQRRQLRQQKYASTEAGVEQEK